jgi:hypothetical protein
MCDPQPGRLKMAKITEKLFKSLRPTDKRQMIMDDKPGGFGVRVNPSGHTVYVFRYCIYRKQGIFRIAPVTAGQARERARKLAGEVANGIDPAAKRHEQRQLPLSSRHSHEHIEVLRSAGSRFSWWAKSETSGWSMSVDFRDRGFYSPYTLLSMIMLLSAAFGSMLGNRQVLAGGQGGSEIERANS